MNKIVKHSISQTKDYACSSEFVKDFAKQTALTGIGVIVAKFMWNVLDNITSENK